MQAETLAVNLAAVCCLVVLGRPSDHGELRSHALEGAVGLLQCPVFQYGAGQQVMWRRKDVDVTQLGPRLTVNQRSGALRIHRSQFQDSGRYTCTVKTENATVSRDIMLHVVSYPKITEVKNASVPRGSQASLICNVSSMPASIITWKRYGFPLDHTTKLSLQEEEIPGAVVHTSAVDGIPPITTSELKFNSVQPSMAGLYLCQAANTPGTARATLALHVVYAPVPIVETPRVVAWKGHVPQLNMKFKANPPPRIVCRHGSEKHSSSDFWETAVEAVDKELTNVTIMVFPRRTSHPVYGTFTCTATNSAGEASGDIELIEGQLPRAPGVTVDSKKPTWLVLELRMPADMGLPPADRIIARYEDMTVESEIVEFDKVVRADDGNTTQHWNMTGLKPGHRYRFTLRLSNSFAKSNATVFSETLPLKAVPDPVQFTSPPDGDQPRHYLLQWLPPTTYGANITGYTLQYRPVKVSGGAEGPHTVLDAGPETRVSVGKSVKQVVISSLQENTYYRLSMTAHSDLGDSQPASFLFRTANDSNPGKTSWQDTYDGTGLHYSKPESPMVLEGSLENSNGNTRKIMDTNCVVLCSLLVCVHTFL